MKAPLSPAARRLLLTAEGRRQLVAQVKREKRKERTCPCANGGYGRCCGTGRFEQPPSDRRCCSCCQAGEPDGPGQRQDCKWFGHQRDRVKRVKSAIADAPFPGGYNLNLTNLPDPFRCPMCGEVAAKERLVCRNVTIEGISYSIVGDRAMTCASCRSTFYTPEQARESNDKLNEMKRLSAKT